jgi:hypothetical protein
MNKALALLFSVFCLLTHADLWASCRSTQLYDDDGSYLSCRIDIDGRLHEDSQLSEEECEYYCDDLKVNQDPSQIQIPLNFENALRGFSVPSFAPVQTKGTLKTSSLVNKTSKASKASHSIKPTQVTHKSRVQVGRELPKTYDEAVRIFEEVASYEDVPHRYIQGGCDARAHIVSHRLQQEGIRTKKIWLLADTSPKVDPLILWNFHVATAIYLPTGVPKKFAKWVIDPSLASRPLSVKQWVSLIKLNEQIGQEDPVEHMLRTRIVYSKPNRLRKHDLDDPFFEMDEERSDAADLSYADTENAVNLGKLAEINRLLHRH